MYLVQRKEDYDIKSNVESISEDVINLFPGKLIYKTIYIYLYIYYIYIYKIK